MTANSDTKQEIEAISSFVFNFPLVESLFQSIQSGLREQSVHFAGGNTGGGVFKQSLDAAVKDIKDDPRGLLFKRLIQYGPHTDTDPHEVSGGGNTILSDPEWGKCVEFIFSYMINRFKGELAELLGVQPCLELMETLEKENRLPGGLQVYWGDALREYSRGAGTGDQNQPRWYGPAKGADGLLVEHIRGPVPGSLDKVKVHGIVEIKSMRNEPG